MQWHLKIVTGVKMMELLLNYYYKEEQVVEVELEEK